MDQLSRNILQFRGEMQVSEGHHLASETVFDEARYVLNFSVIILCFKNSVVEILT
jgi:hypothetical protein